MNILSLLLFIAASIIHLYASYHQDTLLRSQSKGFILPGLIGFYIFSSPSICSFVLLALVLSWMGDVLLIPKGKTTFLFGGLCFVLSHICFAISYFKNIDLSVIPFWIVLLAILVYIILSYLALKGVKDHLNRKLFYPFLIYLLTNGFMNCCALFQMLTDFNLSTAIIYAGAVCFFISDGILFHVRFNNKSRFKSHFPVMLTYVIAEFLIVLGILMEDRFSIVFNLGVLKCLLVAIAVFIGLQLLFVLFAFIVGRFVDTSRPLEKQSKLCLFCCRVVAVLGCGYLGIRFHISGEELIPENGRFVLICNHRSGFDPFSNIWNLRKYNISYISKIANMEIPIAGRIAYGMGCLGIDRENDRKAMRTIITASDYLKRNLCSICIYPEGTRSKTGEVLPFHAGSFKLAQKARVPIVIASTHGTEKATKNLFKRCTDVYLDILEVVDAETVSKMKTIELSEYTRNKIIESFNNR